MRLSSGATALQVNGGWIVTDTEGFGWIISDWSLATSNRDQISNDILDRFRDELRAVLAQGKAHAHS